MSLVLVYGTRPDAVKVGPVVAALHALGERPIVVCSGQHTDLLMGTPAETDLVNGTSLGLKSDGHIPRWMTNAELAFTDYFQTFNDPPVVVVQGDTMTALAAAKSAANLEIPVAHIEAGVRSHNLEDPWPEELNRREITTLTSWHYAHSTTAYANLLSEGVDHRTVRLTGNPGMSALKRYSNARPIHPPEPTILITLHRRELLQRPDFLSALDGLKEAALVWPELQFIWPIHPGVLPHIPVSWANEFSGNVRLIDPLPYRQMALLLASSTGVVTDSGGVQEEAAALGVPCICLRRFTDRPESIEAGVAMRCDPNAVGFAQGVEMLARGRLERRPIDAYGDVLSADMIARHLAGLVS